MALFGKKKGLAKSYRAGGGVGGLKGSSKAMNIQFGRATVLNGNGFNSFGGQKEIQSAGVKENLAKSDADLPFQ